MVSSRISVLGVSYTNMCTASCDHCCSYGSPRQSTKLSPDLLLPHLQGFHDLGVRTFCVTGGEPVLFLDELEIVMKAAQKLSWRQVLFTNGFWAGGENEIQDYVRRFSRIGVGTVIFSTSRFHAKYVDPENIWNAAHALEKKGIGVTIDVCTLNTLDMDDYSRMLLAARAPGQHRRLKIVPDGRAKRFASRDLHAYPQKVILNRICPQREEFYVDENGDVFPCCCISHKKPETLDFYRFGNIKSDGVKEIMAKRSTRNESLQRLFSSGPGSIYRRFERELRIVGFELRERYSSQCDLCKELFGNPRNLQVVLGC